MICVEKVLVGSGRGLINVWGLKYALAMLCDGHITIESVRDVGSEGLKSIGLSSKDIISCFTKMGLFT